MTNKRSVYMIDDIIQINASTQTERNKTIDQFKNHGITQIKSKPVEQIVKVVLPSSN